MSSKTKMKAHGPAVLISGDVLRRIRQHARSQSKTEVCGVLIGSERNGKLDIAASIPGVNAAQAGTHVTFTQDTWEHIYKVKDKNYPDERIVGWYHSHPGFGVFLSDHDTFIHKNFFSAPQQVAWVYDPHSDEEGCFGWVGSRLERLSQIAVSDHKGGEGAGETGKPEPVGYAGDGDDEVVFNDEPQAIERPRKNEPAWLQWAMTILSHLSMFGLGFIACWMLFPQQPMRYIVALVDPMTKEVLSVSAPLTEEMLQQLQLKPSAVGVPTGEPPKAAQSPSTIPSNDSKKGDNGQRK